MSTAKGSVVGYETGGGTKMDVDLPNPLGHGGPPYCHSCTKQYWLGCSSRLTCGCSRGQGAEAGAEAAAGAEAGVEAGGAVV